MAKKKELTSKEGIEQLLAMNKTLVDSIYNACADSAENFHVDYVPIAFVKLICDTAYDKLEEGIRKGYANG